MNPDILSASCQEGARLSQTAELARVKARIKALTEKTGANGCTEAEAMSAAEMVGRLLERYALSMDEIEVREARCVQAEVPMGGQRWRPIDACVPAIARFCDCKVWLARGARPKSDYDEDFDWTQPGGRYVFFGFETDTALAIYLFVVIDRAIATEAVTFKAATRRFGASGCAVHRPVSSMGSRRGCQPGLTPCMTPVKRRSGRNDRPAPRRRGRVPGNQCAAGRDARHRATPNRLGVSRRVAGR
jgi:hypothetical protein